MRDGEPCSHVGCLSHISHPCESCGRIAGKNVITIDDEFKVGYEVTFPGGNTDRIKNITNGIYQLEGGLFLYKFELEELKERLNKGVKYE